MGRVMAVGGHEPVLLEAAMAMLAPERGGTFVDATFGAGNYSRALLERGADRVIAIDRDPDAVRAGQSLTEQFAGRLALRESSFDRLAELVRADEANAIAGVVFDLGVSSNQLDQAERGFSFQQDGPLDMRMARAGKSAADLVNNATESVLARILHVYGEEVRSRRVARAIVRARSSAPIETTGRLCTIVTQALGAPRWGRIHPATRTFQAVRIAVNDELAQLECGLRAATSVLQPGGVLCAVSFHSLEDRLVKRFGRAHSGGGGTYRHLPDSAPVQPVLDTITRRPVRPTAAEIAVNPRSRSARLRAFRRTAAPASEQDLAAGESAGVEYPRW